MRAVRAADHIDAQDIAHKIETGTATRRDLVALLIYMREDIDDGLLKDIAHCVAHTRRNRGTAYEYIEQFLAHFIDIARHGGMLNIKMLFPIEHVAGALHSELLSLGIELEPENVKQHLSELAAVLSTVLDGVALEIQNPHVTSCVFEKGPDGEDTPPLFFTAHFTGLAPGVLTIPKNVGVAMPVLG